MKKKTILNILVGAVAGSAVILMSSKIIFEIVSNVRSKIHFIISKDKKNRENYTNLDVSEYSNIKDYYIKTRDELKLHARVICPDNHEKTNLYAICIHGYLTSGQKELDEIVKYYLSLGINVIVTDERAFGESEGQYTTFGNLESKDHMEWLKFFIHELGEDSRFILHGVSMGAATVLMMCRNELPRNVKGIVAEGAYKSLKEQLIYSFGKNHIPGKTYYALYKLACFMGSVFDPERTKPIDGASNINLPVLFVHGQEDEVVPCEMTEEMFEICPSINKKMLLVENAGHGECLKYSDKYKAVLRIMVDKLK